MYLDFLFDILCIFVFCFVILYEISDCKQGTPYILLNFIFL